MNMNNLDFFIYAKVEKTQTPLTGLSIYNSSIGRKYYRSASQTNVLV